MSANSTSAPSRTLSLSVDHGADVRIFGNASSIPARIPGSYFRYSFSRLRCAIKAPSRFSRRASRSFMAMGAPDRGQVAEELPVSLIAGRPPIRKAV